MVKIANGRRSVSLLHTLFVDGEKKFVAVENALKSSVPRVHLVKQTEIGQTAHRWAPVSLNVQVFQHI